MTKIQANSVVNSVVNQRSLGCCCVVSHDITAALALNTLQFALCMPSHLAALVTTARNISNHIQVYQMLGMVVILLYIQFFALIET